MGAAPTGLTRPPPISQDPFLGSLMPHWATTWMMWSWPLRYHFPSIKLPWRMILVSDASFVGKGQNAPSTCQKRGHVRMLLARLHAGRNCTAGGLKFLRICMRKNRSCKDLHEEEQKLQ